MKRCTICEGYLPAEQFPMDGPICKPCVVRLQKLYHIDYSPPSRKTIKHAYLSLLVAVKDQAYQDGEISDWERSWLYSDPWDKIWGIFKEGERQSSGSSNDFYSCTGGSND